MNDHLPEPWNSLHPAVPRHWLFLFAGLLWTGVGILLWYRTIDWIAPLEPWLEVTLEGAGFALAVVGYVRFFRTVAERNIARIENLPARVCAFAFTAWRGYLMIALMITIGVTLRNSPVPKIYLVVPYTFMGGMLLAGSQRFLRRFAAAVRTR